MRLFLGSLNKMHAANPCHKNLTCQLSKKKKFLSLRSNSTSYRIHGFIYAIVFGGISLFSPLHALAAKPQPRTKHAVAATEEPAGFVDDFSGGKTLSASSGVAFNTGELGNFAEFKKGNESRLVYSYEKGFPRQGTAEIIIKVDNAYHYADGTLKDNQDCALIFTTDIQGGDVTWPGSAWLYTCRNGDISFHIAGEKFENGWAEKYKLVAKGTEFRFGAWHLIGISYGSAGRSIMLNGKVVASNQQQTQALAGGGDRSQSLGQPTIGESVTYFWRNNQHEGGFEGGVQRVLVADAQNKWTLSKNAETLDKLKLSRAQAAAASPVNQASESVATASSTGKNDGNNKENLNGDASATKKQTFPDSISLPEKRVIKSTQGCKLINPQSQPNETVQWTGSCKNGYAQGSGTATWFKGGKPDGSESSGYYENGLGLKPYVDDMPNYLIASPDKQCGFVLPIPGINAMLDSFSIEFDGACPTATSTLISDGRGEGSARIYFRNELFATYKGKFARRVVPVDGELVLFSGSKFVFSDKVDFSGLLTQTTINNWLQNIKVVRAPAKTNMLALKDAFNIKLGFNAKPVAPQEDDGKILVFPVTTISSDNTIKAKYSVTPVNVKKLKSRQYTISLKVEIKLLEKSSALGFSVSETRSIFKDIDIRLNKKNGYKSSGEIVVAELTSYLSGLGATKSIESVNPSVTIDSIVGDQ